MPFSVRGRVRAMQMIAETPAQSTEHDAPEVTVKAVGQPECYIRT